MRRWMTLATGMAACAADPTPKDTTPAPPDGSTEPTVTATHEVPPAPVIAASCALDANPLRVRCAATLSGPGSTAVEVSAVGAPSHTYVDNVSAVEHELVAWGLRPDTIYTWVIGDFTGTVATGSLPPDLAGATVEVTGEAIGFDAVLHPLDCGDTEYVTMIDGDGIIVWFEPNDVFFRGSMTGYDWSEASRSVMSINGQAFEEQHVSGDVILTLDRGIDFDHTLHHDVARWGRYRYLLFERPVGNLNVDGFHVFDGDQLVDTWYMDDAFTVAGGGGGGDWAHANGLKATDTGELILSVLNFSAVISIDGNPASPGFLDVLWHGAGGSGAGLPDPDYVALAGGAEGFSRQHNASRHGNELWLFDNAGQGNSRAVRLQIDHAAHTLAVIEAWSFQRQCRNQGGAVPVDGGVLATCANSGQVAAFANGASAPGWTLSATCDAGAGGLALTRAIPVLIE